eukprot:g3033.t1
MRASLSLTRVPFVPCLPRQKRVVCSAEKHSHSQSLDFYDILQVDYDATIGEIKFNYRKLQKQFHPDISGDSDKSSVLNEAYQTLIDPNLRAQYDRKLSAMPLSHRAMKRAFKDQPGVVGPLSDAELVMKQMIPQGSHSIEELKNKTLYWLREWAKTFLFASDYPVTLPLQCDDVENGVRLAFITTSKNRIRSAGELHFVVDSEDNASEDNFTSFPLYLSVYRTTMKEGVIPGEFQVMKAFNNALKDKHEAANERKKFLGFELTGIAATVAAEFMPVFVGLPFEKVDGSSYAAYHLKHSDTHATTT